MKSLIICVATSILVTACVSNRIVDKPIIFDNERIALTKEYLEDRYGLVSDNIEINPRMVVIHFTVIPTFQETFDAFNSSKLPGSRAGIADASALNVSSQFLVDRDGTIYRLMPELYMARHTIGLNHCAIGIENVGGTADLPLTKDQLKANIWLVKYLAEKYPIEYVIGHSEYTLFENHELWLEKDPGYRTEKTDPGDDFMLSIREATKYLNFKSIPK